MSEALYPFKFREIYLEKVWGGEKIRRVLGKDAPDGVRIGESWELSDEGANVSVVRNGRLAGKTLRELVRVFGEKLLGGLYAGATKFPLLVKYIDAAEWLSVQVHPDDETARRTGAGQNGKTECWLIVDCGPDAEIIQNFTPGTKKEDFERLVAEGRMERAFNRERVARGDLFYLPSGMLHATGKDMLLLEVQQSSDVTYRLFDWGRSGLDGRPRELHLEKALTCLKYDFPERGPHRPVAESEYLYNRKFRLRSPYFNIEEWNFSDTLTFRNDPGSFEILCAIEGGGEILYGAPLPRVETISRGETVLIPAGLGEYEIAPAGDTRIVHVYREA